MVSYGNNLQRDGHGKRWQRVNDDYRGISGKTVQVTYKREVAVLTRKKLKPFREDNGRQWYQSIGQGAMEGHGHSDGICDSKR